KDDPLRKEASFRPDTPYAAKVVGRGEDVCWSVKRAFLTQGYMIDRGGSDTLIMSGTKGGQTDDETKVSPALQPTRRGNRARTRPMSPCACRRPAWTIATARARCSRPRPRKQARCSGRRTRRRSEPASPPSACRGGPS